MDKLPKKHLLLLMTFKGFFLKDNFFALKPSYFILIVSTCLFFPFKLVGSEIGSEILVPMPRPSNGLTAVSSSGGDQAPTNSTSTIVDSKQELNLEEGKEALSLTKNPDDSIEICKAMKATPGSWRMTANDCERAFYSFNLERHKKLISNKIFSSPLYADFGKSIVILGQISSPPLQIEDKIQDRLDFPTSEEECPLIHREKFQYNFKFEVSYTIVETSGDKRMFQGIALVLIDEAKNQISCILSTMEEPGVFEIVDP